MKKIDKNTKILFILTIIFFIFVVGVSLALPDFLVNLQGINVNKLESCKLNVTLTDENAINLVSAYPMDDNDALKGKPYKVTLTKTGNCENYGYVLNMKSSCDDCTKTDGKCTIGESTCDCNNQLSSNLIRYYVKDNSTNKKYTGNNPYNMNISGSFEDGEDEKTFDMLLWIDKDATNSDLVNSNGVAKDFCSKLGAKVTNRFANNIIANQVQTMNISYKYINNANKTINGIRYNVNDNGVFLFNGTDDNGGNYPIYYYRGNVTNNNVLFGGFCWKIVRTTSTGGTKLIYNGLPFYEYENTEKLNESSYVVTTNTPTTYPFTFDSSTKMWSSGIAGQKSTTNTIEFTVTEAGDYVLNYTVGSEANYDKVSFYKNGTALASNISGANQIGSLDLAGLTTSDVIKVTYTKDSSGDQNGDKVSFSIAKGIGEKTLSCNNTGTASQLSSKSAFNTNYSSPADVGYMYGTRYRYSYKDMSSVTDTYKYGNDVTYSNGTYTLSGKTMDSTSWSTDKATLADGYHYTCLNSTGTCTSVYYITYFGTSSSSYMYYLPFTGGDNLDSAKEKMFEINPNQYDSTIKTAIDNWYSTNLTDYTSYLENTIFCNDRTDATTTRYKGPLASKDTNSTGVSYFKSWENTINGTPSLECTNINDRFSLKVESGGTNGYGNNKLTYPVGLLTYDEAELAGGQYTSNSNYYLYTGSDYWLLSPSDWSGDDAGAGRVHVGGRVSADLVGFAVGVRPSVSLQPGTQIIRGTGISSDPYVITELS